MRTCARAFRRGGDRSIGRARTTCDPAYTALVVESITGWIGSRDVSDGDTERSVSSYTRGGNRQGLALHWQDRGRQRFGPSYATPVYDEEMRGSRGRYRAARAFSGAVSNQS